MYLAPHARHPPAFQRAPRLQPRIRHSSWASQPDDGSPPFLLRDLLKAALVRAANQKDAALDIFAKLLPAKPDNEEKSEDVSTSQFFVGKYKPEA